MGQRQPAGRRRRSSTACSRRRGRYLADRDLFVFDGYAGADPRYRLPVRVITECAWHNLFARNMFVRETDRARARRLRARAHVIDCPACSADPATDGTRTSTFILLNLAERLVLIGGTEYAGEIKKSIFSVMNYLLPKQGVLPMHCSANYGRDRDDVALFFGLSGTGKTTLSADPERTLIGDDEHGWSDHGVFNFEGGCYAKVIRLSREAEPEIYATTGASAPCSRTWSSTPTPARSTSTTPRRPRTPAPATRSTQLERVDLGGVAGHPKNVVFLTCDAFGVLPPIARLDEAQAMYHFLSGYTAKVAGTERGVTEPQATFSTCFGAPFLPLHPPVYARMLGEKLRQHGAQGLAGQHRLDRRRARRRQAHQAAAHAADGGRGAVRRARRRGDPPRPGLRPRGAARGRGRAGRDPRAARHLARQGRLRRAAAKLADMFVENFQQFAEEAGPEITAAGPRRAAVSR